MLQACSSFRCYVSENITSRDTSRREAESKKTFVIQLLFHISSIMEIVYVVLFLNYEQSFRAEQARLSAKF
jgi:hypothetical protein